MRIEFLRVLRNILRKFELVMFVGKEFQRRGPVNIRERKPYWVVLDRSSDLSVSVPIAGTCEWHLFFLQKTIELSY